MYNDIADAVESLRKEGFVLSFEIEDHHITAKEKDLNLTPDQIDVVKSYTHDAGTDPGSESTVYALETKSGHKGLLVVAFGMYADPSKASLIDKLLKK
jgi:hypothetical protein